MPLNITLDIPPDLEQKLRRESADLEAEIREVYVLELFRCGRLSHYDLSRVLGLDRWETDAFLKRHQVFEGSLTMDDLEADWQALQRMKGEPD